MQKTKRIKLKQIFALKICEILQQKSKSHIFFENLWIFEIYFAKKND